MTPARNKRPWSWPETVIGLIIGGFLGVPLARLPETWLAVSLIALPLLLTMSGLFVQKQVDSVSFIRGWSLSYALVLALVLYHQILPIPFVILLASLYFMICSLGSVLLYSIADFINARLHKDDTGREFTAEDKLSD